MVSLVRLSSSNLDEFKKLYEENFQRETYDKDFFEYYYNQSFIPKIFLKTLFCISHLNKASFFISTF